MRMTSQTFEVFWPRVLLQCTAAGDLNADGRTAHTQDFRAPDTIQVGHRNHKASHLPQQKANSPSNSPSRSSCGIQISEFKPPLNSWARLTSTHRSPPLLLVKLEQDHVRSIDFRGGKKVSTRASGFPYQDFILGPPCWNRMNYALVMDEVEKLIRKQAIALVTPVAG